MIAIIDYGMGNLRSVQNAFATLGHEVEIVSNPDRLIDAAGVVLPGVGAFGDAMKSLDAAHFLPALENVVLNQGRPYLGICLGLQLLAETGSEHGIHRGFGWVAGSVNPLSSEVSGCNYRIPHIGWNKVRCKKNSSFTAEMEDAYFYFVHSFALNPEDPTIVSGTCLYGEEIVAALEKDNILAVQFHPEKSGEAGLRLLRAWCEKIE